MGKLSGIISTALPSLTGNRREYFRVGEFLELVKKRYIFIGYLFQSLAGISKVFFLVDKYYIPKKRVVVLRGNCPTN